ncbi:MAG: S24 family peptidase [Chloroflexi bacterium]|nr:S24 family peptidase [Chloroflexota bacterium]
MSLGHAPNWLNRIINLRKGIPYGQLRALADELDVSAGELVEGPRGEGAWEEEFRAAFVPVYPAPVAAGFVGKSVVSPKMSAPHCFSRQRLAADGIEPYNATVYQVVGDSMLPTLVDGCRVLVDKAKTTPSPNSLFVIADDGSLLIKRFKRVKSRSWWCSDNPEFVPIRHRQSIKVQGQVRWTMRRFDDDGH